LILSVETEELGIAAGLQDRVAQVYEAPVFMDFDQMFMKQHGHGMYRTFSSELLPSLYIAYRTDLAEGSEVVHNRLRQRFMEGDPQVLGAMQSFAQLTNDCLKLVENGKGDQIGKLLNQNFDLRASIMRIPAENQRMVDLARSVGASAKFTGSGGAIIGTYENGEMLEALTERLAQAQIALIAPQF
ncbi:MAG: GHMP kinase, partial [Bacteroidota bacterium]